jgi:hypothetical protein
MQHRDVIELSRFMNRYIKQTHWLAIAERIMRRQSVRLAAQKGGNIHLILRGLAGEKAGLAHRLDPRWRGLRRLTLHQAGHIAEHAAETSRRLWFEGWLLPLRRCLALMDRLRRGHGLWQFLLDRCGLHGQRRR